MSHTHAGANVNSQLADKPGGELIEPYIEHLTEQIGAAILEARERLAPAWVTYGTGRCALAANRDLWDAEAERFAAGYNPDAPADDTLARREGDRRGRRRARDAVQLRVPPDDACLGEPAALARLHRRRARGPGERVRRPRALPPGRLGRARAARRLRRRRGRRRPQRPPARARRSGGDREPAAARARASSTPGSSRRAPTSARGSTSRATPAQLRGQRAAGGARDHRRAAPQGGHRRRREPRAAPDSVQEQEKALRRRFLSAGARRRSGLRDADLDLAARRRAARRDPERALLGASRSSCGAASPTRRCSCSA